MESIYSLAALVQRLVPEARVAVAHGQMPEAELEKAMLAFVEGRADVLVATTIIENGLDIPRANTLIVNRADRYGLAQLYQLRGRVGRSDRRAYAYLLVPPDTVLSEIAQKRLAAIREFSDLGAGFRIAALDLEIRGAGNLLGGEQSGHIQAVGLDLYVKLLEQTILELKGQALARASRAVLNLHLDLRIPGDYVPEVHQRMSLYKRVSQAGDAAELESLAGRGSRPLRPLPPPGRRALLVRGPAPSGRGPGRRPGRRCRGQLLRCGSGPTPPLHAGGPGRRRGRPARRPPQPRRHPRSARHRRAPDPRARRGPGPPRAGRSARRRYNRSPTRAHDDPSALSAPRDLRPSSPLVACRERQAADPVILSLDDQVVRRSEFAKHVTALEAQGGERSEPRRCFPRILDSSSRSGCSSSKRGPGVWSRPTPAPPTSNRPCRRC